MPGLIQITVEPGVNVDAFRTVVIDREDTIKLIIGNRPFIFLLKFTRGIVVDNPVKFLQSAGIARRFQNTVEQVDGTVPFDVFFHDQTSLRLKFFFEDLLKHFVFAIGEIAVPAEAGKFFFPTFDVFAVDNLKSVDSCVSSHFLILLIWILV